MSQKDIKYIRKVLHIDLYDLVQAGVELLCVKTSIGLGADFRSGPRLLTKGKVYQVASKKEVFVNSETPAKLVLVKTDSGSQLFFSIGFFTLKV
jgi:hypothetical protein